MCYFVEYDDHKLTLFNTVIYALKLFNLGFWDSYTKLVR